MFNVPENIREASILVVDDKQDNIDVLTQMLVNHGFTNISAVTDPREVEPLYKATPFDLVLLDIRMPHLDGFQVMERLKVLEEERIPNIMVLTAQTDRKTKYTALDMGARDFLYKPFDQIEAMARIRNMIETHLLHDKVRRQGEIISHQNDILEQRVRQRTQELEETRLEVVRQLGRAAEYKDNETGLHVVRMSKICQILARAVGMSDDESELLLNASPMHDIGKIGIPDHILTKPGKLDDAEWAAMKTHAVIGFEILGEHTSPLLRMARVVAITHHERWDGAGYPKGLAGDDIPLVGRVCALADVFDALTSERPYKHGWSIADAVDYIKQQSGKQFDPQLVEKFMAHLPKIVSIHDNYQEGLAR